MIRAIIFDFNGVLVDDESVHFELFREVLAQEGIDLTEEVYHDRYLGFDDRGGFEAALTEAGQAFDPRQIQDLIARKALRYGEVAESGLKFFPEAAETLRRLADRYPLAICSGALRPEIEYALQRLGVRDRVHAIVSAEDTTRCKPDPEGYLLALQALRDRSLDDLQANQCLVVEDSLAGIKAALAAGMRVFGVSHSYSHLEMNGAGAEVVIDRLSEIDPDRVGPSD
ncbi:HAD family phosphatase [soil metagenome]